MPREPKWKTDAEKADHVRTALCAADAALSHGLDNTGRDATSYWWQPLIQVRVAFASVAGARVIRPGTGTEDDAYLARVKFKTGGMDVERWYVVLEAGERDAREFVRDDFAYIRGLRIDAWPLAEVRRKTIPGRYLFKE